MNQVKLSDRVRPNSEFAAWVRTEIKALENTLAEQVREIERLRLNIAEYNEHERCYQSELAALSAPSYAQDAGEVVAYWSDFSMVSVRFGDRVRTYVESCAPSHGERVRDVLPGGWTAKPTDDREGFIISSPRVNGVASHFSVFPDSKDYASCALWKMLAAAPSATCQHRFVFFGDQTKRRCADCCAVEETPSAAAPSKEGL